MDPAQDGSPEINKPNRRYLFPLLILFFVLLASTAIFFYVTSRSNPTQPVTAQDSKKIDTVRVLMSQPINNIYPKSEVESSALVFNTNFFDGLVNLRNGKLENALALNWVTVDSYTWRFNLRQGVKFSNGTSFTANDVKFSIEEGIRNKWPLETPLTNVSQVTILGDYAIEIKTTKPVPDLISLLNALPIISKEQFENKSENDWPVGTGPYRLVLFDRKTKTTTDPQTEKTTEITDTQTIKIEENPFYYGEKPQVKTVIFDYLNPDQIAALSVQEIQNKYDAIDSLLLQPEQAQTIQINGFTKVTVERPTVRILLINADPRANKWVTGSTNPFSNQKVRQALYLSFDSEQFIKQATVEGKPATQLATRSVIGYDPQITRPRRDVTKAKALLQEAGYPQGITFTLDFPNNRVPQAEEIARQLKEAGFTVKLNPLARDPGLKKLFASDFSMFYTAWTSDYFETASIFTDALTSKSSQNYAKYSNPQMDAYAEQISQTQEPSERLQLLQRAMRYAMEELPYIPVYEEVSYYWVRNTLEFTPSRVLLSGYDLKAR